MKRRIILALSTLLAGSSSCKKEPGPSEIFGDWQWVSSTGGFTGKQVYTPASTNSSRTLSFTRDSLSVECINGKCQPPLRFSSRPERSIFDGKLQPILTIHHKLRMAPPDTGYYIILDRYTIREVSNSLRLDQEVYDGFGEVFQRK